MKIIFVAIIFIALSFGFITQLVNAEESYIDSLDKNLESAQKTIENETGKHLKQILKRIAYAYKSMELWLKEHIGFNSKGVLSLLQRVSVRALESWIEIWQWTKALVTSNQ